MIMDELIDEIFGQIAAEVEKAEKGHRA